MWVVEACFDGSEQPTKRLLRPGTSYTIGRKGPVDLVLADKTVSQDAGSVSVTDYRPSSDSMQDADRLPPKPRVRLHVGKKLIRIIAREHEAAWQENPEAFIGEECRSGMVREVEDGDLIVVSRAAPAMRLKWIPVMFWAMPSVLSESVALKKRQELHKLGAELVMSDAAPVACTHFITNSAKPTDQILGAFVSSLQIVTVDFVDELLSSIADDDRSVLENEWVLPVAEDHFPSDPKLDPITYEEMKAKAGPDKARASIFRDVTILFISTDEAARDAFRKRRDIYTAAGATTETCMPALLSRLAGDKEEAEKYLLSKRMSTDSSRSYSQMTSSSASDFQGLVIIAACPEEEEVTWYATFARLSHKLKIPMPAEGMKALDDAIIFKAPARFLNQLGPEQEQELSPLRNNPKERPDVFNRNATLAMDPQQDSLSQSQAVPPEPGFVQSSTPLLQVPLRPFDAAVVPLTPSRRPKRRAGREHADPFADVFGGATSVADAAVPQPPPRGETQSTELGPTQPTPTIAAARLRRKMTESREQPRRSDVWRSILEDGSAPRDSASAQIGSASTPTGNTQERYSKRFRLELDEVDRRETQRTQGSLGPNEQDDDADLTVMPPSTQEASKQSKRRAEDEIEDERDATPKIAQHRPDSVQAYHSRRSAEEEEDGSRAGGERVSSSIRAVPMDTSSLGEGLQFDAKFLQSIASMKNASTRKSKKPVDALDAEFDKLRIKRPSCEVVRSGSKTVLVDEDALMDPAYRVWQQMSTDDFDVSAGGNFVQVDFVPLVRRRDDGHGKGNDSSQASWSGRPNFKKFRVKNRARREPLVLVDSERSRPDYGVGPQYAAGIAKSIANSMRIDACQNVTQEKAQTLSETQTKHTIFAGASEGEEVHLRQRTTNRSATQRNISNSRTQTRATLLSHKDRAIVIYSSDEEWDRRPTRDDPSVKSKAGNVTKANLDFDMRLDVDDDDMDMAMAMENGISRSDHNDDNNHDDGADETRTARTGLDVNLSNTQHGIPQSLWSKGEGTQQQSWKSPLSKRKHNSSAMGSRSAGATERDSDSSDQDFTFKSNKRMRKAIVAR